MFLLCPLSVVLCPSYVGPPRQIVDLDQPGGLERGQGRGDILVTLPGRMQDADAFETNRLR